MMRLAVVNGPNLGRLGQRQPEIYGVRGWEQIWEDLTGVLPHVTLEYFQSNHEGAILDYLETLSERGAQGLVINPGALTHQSYALLDGLKALSIPIIEVHLSNIYAREAFRAHSLTAPAAWGLISGLGPLGYELAIRALAAKLGD